MQRRVREGGLLPCCMEELTRYSGTEAVGTELVCAVHPADGNTMVVAADGVWEWSGVAGVNATITARMGRGGAVADADR